MTGNDLLVVNFAALAQASSDIQRAVTTLHQEVEQLEHAAAPLVNAWDGTAREAYDQRQAAWRSASASLSQMLADIRRAVDEAAIDYQQTERQNTALFQ